MNIKYIILLFVGAITLFSCDKEEQIGPDLEGIGFEPTPTTELTSSTREVDFSVGNSTMFFSQEFEKSTNWKITLEGLNSGAKKVLQNSSTSINKENSLWDGLADGTPYFQKEKVKVTLSYPNYPEFEVSIDTFAITGIVANSIKSVLFTSFDVLPTIYFFSNASRPLDGWVTDWPTTTNTNTKFDKYNGTPYLFLEGSPWEEDANGKGKGTYIDITEMPASKGDTVKSKYLPLYSDPSRVYVNLAVYGTGTLDAHLSVQFVEDNGTGITRVWSIKPTWSGWKNISIKYSDLVSEDKTAYNPQIVKKIGLLFESDEDVANHPNRKTVSIAIDQLEFSFDSPLGTVNY